MKKVLKNLMLVAVMTVLCMAVAVTASALDETGQCGDNVYWDYNQETGELVISGEGEMWDYTGYNTAPFSNQGVDSIIITDGVTSIGDYALCGCRWITSLTIPDSVTTIGDRAIFSCESLMCVTIPDSVTSIGDYAFSGCESLKNVTLPNGITSLSTGLFSYCKNLDYIEIPNSVKDISYNVLYGTSCYNNEANWRNGLFIVDGCIFESMMGPYAYIPADVRAISNMAFITTVPYVKSFEVDPDNRYYSADEYGVLYNKDKTELINYPGALRNKSYTIPNTVEKIHVFYNIYIETLVIPESVKEFPELPFLGCSVKDVYIYSDDVEINYDCFLCLTDTDQAKWFEVRDELAEIFEDYYLRYFNGTLTQEEAELINKGLDKYSYLMLDDYVPCGTIHANIGSTAEAYANEFGISFEEIKDKKTVTDTGTGIVIEYADGTFNEEAEFVINKVITNANYVFASLFSKFASYDISFMLYGERVQPNGKVTVKIPLPENYNVGTTFVYYVDDSGNYEKLDSTYSDGYIIFETDHFSEYAIVDESSEIIDEPVTDPEEPTTDPDDDTTDNNCSCNCHKSGFMGFIWKLLRFFYKLFKINPVCACGVAHY